MLKLLLGAALAAAPAFAPPQEQIAFTQFPMVHRVDCHEGRGSAFRVGGNHFVSAAHVTALTGCAIDGVAITVTEQDGANDFSQFDAGPPMNGFRIDCDGYVPGQWVWATGFAHGMPFQTNVALLVTYAKDSIGRQILIGDYSLIPGMSGGPIMNRRGEVIGIVNAFVPGTPFSLSRPLHDTSICKGMDIA